LKRQHSADNSSYRNAFLTSEKSAVGLNVGGSSKHYPIACILTLASMVGSGSIKKNDGQVKAAILLFYLSVIPVSDNS
jgi:hypothetical protein